MDEFAAKPVAIGIPWYSREAYPEVLEIMEDADDFPVSYEDWRQFAEASERQVEEAGTAAVRAFINPDEFPFWCSLRGIRADDEARTEFANDLAQRLIKNAH